MLFFNYQEGLKFKCNIAFAKVMFLVNTFQARDSNFLVSRAAFIDFRLFGNALAALPFRLYAFQNPDRCF